MRSTRLSMRKLRPRVSSSSLTILLRSLSVSTKWRMQNPAIKPKQIKQVISNVLIKNSIFIFIQWYGERGHCHIDCAIPQAHLPAYHILKFLRVRVGIGEM